MACVVPCSTPSTSLSPWLPWAWLAWPSSSGAWLWPWELSPPWEWPCPDWCRVSAMLSNRENRDRRPLSFTFTTAHPSCFLFPVCRHQYPQGSLNVILYRHKPTCAVNVRTSQHLNAGVHVNANILIVNYCFKARAWIHDPGLSLKRYAFGGVRVCV